MVIKKNIKKKVKLNLQQKQTLKDELKQKKINSNQYVKYTTNL